MKTNIIVLFFLVTLLSSCQPKWEPVFNGDLSNALDEQGVWSYQGDVLTASEDACIFTKVEYENFVIDLEFKNEQGTNSGVIKSGFGSCSTRKAGGPSNPSAASVILRRMTSL